MKKFSKNIRRRNRVEFGRSFNGRDAIEGSQVPLFLTVHFIPVLILLIKHILSYYRSIIVYNNSIQDIEG
uniref:Uncharacterized protein n=1 Tax=Lepeophtheirus salmonis TaxID=72036 RepID=A0A0K2TCU3_LEPSM